MQRWRRHGEAGMARDGRTMPPFHCCPLCTDLCIVWPPLGPLRHSRPASWHRDGSAVDKVHNAACSPGHNGGTWTQAPLWHTRGWGGGLTGRWCCQRLRDVEVAFSADEGLAEVSSFKIHIVQGGLQRTSVCVLREMRGGGGLEVQTCLRHLSASGSCRL